MATFLIFATAPTVNHFSQGLLSDPVHRAEFKSVQRRF